MFFKSTFHKKLYRLLISKLECDDVYYRNFAYVAAATEKKEILKCVLSHEIDVEQLIEKSEVYSSSERALLEWSFQLFNGSMCGLLLKDYSIGNIMRSMDDENKRIVVESLIERY